jgi:hypothetical protein
MSRELLLAISLGTSCLQYPRSLYFLNGDQHINKYRWAEGYEAKFMVPAASNKITSDELVPLLLYYVPGRFKAAAADLVSS